VSAATAISFFSNVRPQVPRQYINNGQVASEGPPSLLLRINGGSIKSDRCELRSGFKTGLSASHGPWGHPLAALLQPVEVFQVDFAVNICVVARVVDCDELGWVGFGDTLRELVWINK